MLTGGRRGADSSQRGLTIIEVIVAIVILGIIMVPLTMVAVGMFKNTADAKQMLDRNNDAQRIAAAWTSDVQSVNPGGVNAEGKECMPLTSSGAPESLLISFSWTTMEDTGSGVEKVDRSSTWIASGIGTDVSLLRRECVNGTFDSEQWLAKQIGEPGKQGIDVIHGPAKTAQHDDPHTARSFCPREKVGGSGDIVGRTCTIVVDGSWKYDLQVTRRVPEIFESGSLVQAPAAPRNLTAQPRNGSISTRYESPVMQPGQPPVDRYRVQARPAAGGPAIHVEVAGGGDPTFTTVEGLDNGTEYFIMVQAHNSVGWGDWTEEIGPMSPRPTEPNAPTDIEAMAGDEQVTVRFKPPTNDGGAPITSWNIYGTVGTEGDWMNLSGGVVSPIVFGAVGGASPAVTQNGDHFEAVVTGLENGEEYRFFVSGVNSVHQNTASPNPPFILRPGEGLLSAESNRVIPFGAPPAPSNIVVAGENPSSNSETANVRISWVGPAEEATNGTTITGYRVLTYRGIDASTPVDSSGEAFTPQQVGCGGSSTVCEHVIELPITQANAGDHYFRFTVHTIGTADDGTEVESAESVKSVVSGSHRIPPAVADHVHPSRRPDKVAAAPTVEFVGSNVVIDFEPPFDGGEAIEAVRLRYRSRSTQSGSSWSSWIDDVYGPVTEVGNKLRAEFPSPGSNQTYEVTIAAGNRGEWDTSGDITTYRYGQASPSRVATHVGPPTIVRNVSVERPSGSFGRQLKVSYDAPLDNGGSPITEYEISCTAPNGTIFTTARSTSGTFIFTDDNIRDGRWYSCSVFARNSMSVGQEGHSAGTARPYGECTLKTNATTWIDENSKNSSNKNTTDMEVRRNVYVWPITYAYEKWSMVGFDFTAGCTSGHVMPAPAWIDTGTFRAWNVDGNTNRTHRLSRVTSSGWENSTWNNKPTVGASIGTWSVGGDGPKAVSGIAEHIRALKDGDFKAFVLQDAGSGSAVYYGTKYGAKNGANPPELEMTFFSQGQ